MLKELIATLEHSKVLEAALRTKDKILDISRRIRTIEQNQKKILSKLEDLKHETKNIIHTNTVRHSHTTNICYTENQRSQALQQIRREIIRRSTRPDGLPKSVNHWILQRQQSRIPIHPFTSTGRDELRDIPPDIK